MNTFIRFHEFWKPNNIRNIVYFDVSKSLFFFLKFKNVTLMFFFKLFGQKHKSERWFENFVMILFHKVIWKSFYF